MGQEIAQALRLGTATVERVRRRCVEEGVKAVLERKRQLNAAGNSWKARVKPT